MSTKCICVLFFRKSCPHLPYLTHMESVKSKVQLASFYLVVLPFVQPHCKATNELKILNACVPQNSPQPSVVPPQRSIGDCSVDNESLLPELSNASYASCPLSEFTKFCIYPCPTVQAYFNAPMLDI